ncbi:hypothetical protein M0R45_006513 [Rubus argutus]|uniref:Uncharacterized protein n=1 Tax=Rubus argutus TaxID=59490 RepID=A0AAW1YQN4_RUBAR
MCTAEAETIEHICRDCPFVQEFLQQFSELQSLPIAANPMVSTLDCHCPGRIHLFLLCTIHHRQQLRITSHHRHFITSPCSPSPPLSHLAATAICHATISSAPINLCLELTNSDLPCCDSRTTPPHRPSSRHYHLCFSPPACLISDLTDTSQSPSPSILISIRASPLLCRHRHPKLPQHKLLLQSTNPLFSNQSILNHLLTA